jgi:hypothetical protein
MYRISPPFVSTFSLYGDNKGNFTVKFITSKLLKQLVIDVYSAGAQASLINVFCDLLQFIQAIAKIVLQFGHNRFIPNPLKYIIHRSL